MNRTHPITSGGWDAVSKDNHSRLMPGLGIPQIIPGTSTSSPDKRTSTQELYKNETIPLCNAINSRKQTEAVYNHKKTKNNVQNRR